MGSKRTLRTTGMGIFLVGLVTFVLSTRFTDGFVHGLFQGMTIALMVGAAYIFGAQWRRGRREGGDAENPDALWLPSHDDTHR